MRVDLSRVLLNRVTGKQGTAVIDTMAQRGNSMGGLDRDKERPRFYLLPGMGGRSARAKHKLILQWSIAIGLIVSIAVGAAIYFANRPVGG
ncbi:MAG: hypothetical protein H7Y43_13325 [Akkermansiaceae bacterium]|nr:hypothetical protein [Verrucomicrobiales bacterium]